MSMTQRALLEALSRDELHQVAQALDVTVADRRRKQGYVEALANARRISKQNLLAALPAASLRSLCQTFKKTPKGRAKGDLIEALSPTHTTAQAKAVPASVAAAKAPAKQAPAKAKAAAKPAAPTPQKAAAKKVAKASAAKGKTKAVKSTGPKLDVAEKAAATQTPKPKAKSEQKPPVTATTPAKARAETALISGREPLKPIAAVERPVELSADTQPRNKGASEPPASDGPKAGPSTASASDKKPGGVQKADATRRAEGKKAPTAKKFASATVKDGAAAKLSSKKGGKVTSATRKKRDRATTEGKADRGTPPRPAAIAPLIGVPRTKTTSQKPADAIEPIKLDEKGGDSEAPLAAAQAQATPAVQAQPPAAIRRGLVSWEEAVSAAQARGQSAESMLGQPAKDEAHDLHQRCPKCKKRVEMQTCQAQLCQNRFVVAPGRRICAECMFERHNLSITDFNARLAEARQCPHCAKPLPERAAG